MDIDFRNSLLHVIQINRLYIMIKQLLIWSMSIQWTLEQYSRQHCLIAFGCFHWTELAGVWTAAEPWEKETKQPDRTAERPTGGDGEMCCYGMTQIHVFISSSTNLCLFQCDWSAESITVSCQNVRWIFLFFSKVL